MRNLLFLFICISTYSQEKLSKNKMFDFNSAYLICRGTKAKAGLIAENFNISDNKNTHVGIGFYESGEKFCIYNMSVDKNHPGLIVDSWNSFREESYCLSVFEIDISNKELIKLKKICHRIQKRNPHFDYHFNLKSKDEFYCSEFCVFVLQKMNHNKYSFTPQIKELNSFYQKVLNCKKLEYYPVDFFQNHPSITKIYEIENL